LRLDDVYCLEPFRSQQRASGASDAQPNLVRLGQKIHRPHDTMYIKSDQVIWWENIQNDGKVVEAIRADKESQR
jgi:hypothetical protein